MLAMQFFEPKVLSENPLVMSELAIPEPGDGQVQLKIKACGVCHTDLHIVEGDIEPSKKPIIPGHQVIGWVEKVGEKVSGINIGERVGVPWLYDACGKCDFCISGQENLCTSNRFTGFDVDGGFSEYMVAEAGYVLPLPETISDEQAAPLLCAGIIGYRSLKKADVNPGERVGLFGFGASAHLTIQVANFWGCEVYVFTRSEKHKNHAWKLGASWVGEAEDQPPRQLDRAVIYAPVGWMVPLVLGKLRPGGTLAINAIHMSPIPEFPYRLMYEERTVRSVANATRQDGIEFLELAEKIPIESTVNLFKLNEANEALVKIKNSKINGEAVLML
jgi:propanol-preferring alcohol dehydrogenase